MKLKLIVIVILSLACVFIHYRSQRPVINPIKSVGDLAPEEEKIDEPNWMVADSVREVNFTGILGDVESHLPAGHPYSDSNKITDCHECTHGINSRLRNDYNDGTWNAFYCLDNKVVYLKEPDTTIKKIAGKIPGKLRNFTYNLYLVKQTHDWNDRPLYLMDEWVAYTNGSACGKELGLDYGSEIYQAHQFNIFCMYMAMTIQEDCVGYDMDSLKAFMMWNIERTFSLIDPENSKQIQDLYTSIRLHSEFKDLRMFAHGFFGKEWCEEVYGF